MYTATGSSPDELLATGPKSPDPVARMTGGTTLAPPRIGMKWNSSRVMIDDEWVSDITVVKSSKRQ